MVGKSPGETPVEQAWPVGSLRYCRGLAKMTGTKRFYIPSDNSILGLDKYGDLPILICFSTKCHMVQIVVLNYEITVKEL